MNSSLVATFIIFLLSFSNLYSQPPTAEELVKIDKIVQDLDKLWDEVATEFANQNGISRSDLPKKIPTHFENAVRTQDRETLYKVYNGQLNWNGKFKEAFISYLEYSTKEGRSLIPTEVYNIDHEKEPPFNAKHLKLLTLGQNLWEEFRLKFIKLNKLKPDALPQKAPKYYRIMISRLSDEEIAQKEKEWDTRTKDKILEMFLQYAEFNYPNKGIRARAEESKAGKREIDAKTILEGEKISNIKADNKDAVQSQIKITEKPSFIEKNFKLGAVIAVVILVLFFLLKK